MIRRLIVPLVGAHFRPPAKLLLAHLASGTKLILEGEPDNPYDSLAIRVLLPSAIAIPQSELESMQLDLANVGSSIESLMSLSNIHLGYIARNTPKVPIGNEDVHAMLQLGACATSLSFDSAGKPQIILEQEG